MSPIAALKGFSVFWRATTGFTACGATSPGEKKCPKRGKNTIDLKP
jgi:hypothetical protein